eukprot:CAMPEP_0113718598 /NCGR_PEP_ID=MMETSP0038_2-20120614/35296_1 /TAXON_ID=2898 /ORGANISM="Cryptomonas paramecium" /LENGTH=181 /DNA_ID=CAMNT_0000646773 /DNA_START=237 /DNA_END=783 /DNA_ORIENTATION=- /assembly_acc=CAM_ASM_000170
MKPEPVGDKTEVKAPPEAFIDASNTRDGGRGALRVERKSAACLAGGGVHLARGRNRRAGVLLVFLHDVCTPCVKLCGFEFSSSGFQHFRQRIASLGKDGVTWAHMDLSNGQASAHIPLCLDKFSHLKVKRAQALTRLTNHRVHCSKELLAEANSFCVVQHTALEITRPVSKSAGFAQGVCI